ncbi:hypothetical protein [Nocardia asteroides]|uniref:hypothetical protein n=1 Tax=Nocardia asteroides TaxID=1824 RepID=UPI001E5CA704|nr:hypothetical protein [Nocardia asteroides]UGT62784.1 hypothetical protein LTT61_05445 [Nocardia asteroides]
MTAPASDPDRVRGIVLRIRVAVAVVFGLLILAGTVGFVFLLHGADPDAQGFDQREVVILAGSATAAVVLAAGAAVLATLGRRSVAVEAALWLVVAALIVGGAWFLLTGTWSPVLWFIAAGASIDMIRASRRS